MKPSREIYEALTALRCELICAHSSGPNGVTAIIRRSYDKSQVVAQGVGSDEHSAAEAAYASLDKESLQSGAHAKHEEHGALSARIVDLEARLEEASKRKAGSSDSSPSRLNIRGTS